jgi:fumarate hydratase class II
LHRCRICIKKRLKIKKGEINVSEEKTFLFGTQYVREMCETFKEIAATTKFDTIKEKLNALATELEPMANDLKSFISRPRRVLRTWKI